MGKRERSGVLVNKHHNGMEPPRRLGREEIFLRILSLPPTRADYRGGWLQGWLLTAVSDYGNDQS